MEYITFTVFRDLWLLGVTQLRNSDALFPTRCWKFPLEILLGICRMLRDICSSNACTNTVLLALDY